MTSPAEHAPAAEASDPVAAAVQQLHAVAELPLDRRPDAFEDIHRRLHSALAEIDDT